LVTSLTLAQKTKGKSLKKEGAHGEILQKASRRAESLHWAGKKKKEGEIENGGGVTLM